MRATLAVFVALVVLTPSRAFAAPEAACIDAEVEATPCELWTLAEMWRARALHAEVEVSRWEAKTSTRTPKRIRALVPVPSKNEGDVTSWCPSPSLLVGGGIGLCGICGAVGAALQSRVPAVTVVLP